jgi:6-phosphofructo-2-kinase/fructose-2,6-biphosphatase 4
MPIQIRRLLITPQIIPASYQNEAKQIQIPDLPHEMIPGSPEGLQMPAPPSGFATPSGLGSALGSPRITSQKGGSPRDGAGTPEAGYKTPEDNDLPSRIHDVI